MIFEIFNEFNIKDILLLNNNPLYKKYVEMYKKNKLYHLWFKKWPDQGVPPIEDIYKYVMYLYNDIKKRKGTTLIHCSGGAGRTGTIYMILYMMFFIDKMKNTKTNVNDETETCDYRESLRKFLSEARVIRPQFVEQPVQYQYIYRILRVYCKNNPDLLKSDSEINDLLNDYYKLLKDYCSIPEGVKTNPEDENKYCKEIDIFSHNDSDYLCKKDMCIDSLNNDHIKKNRYNNTVNIDHMVKLCPHESPNRHNYINAVYMMNFDDGINEYKVIATQAPHEEMFPMFKYMIKTQEVKRIAMLTGLKQLNADGTIDIKANDYFNSTNYFSDNISENLSSDVVTALDHKNSNIYKIGIVNDNWWLMDNLKSNSGNWNCKTK